MFQKTSKWVKVIFPHNHKGIAVHFVKLFGGEDELKGQKKNVGEIAYLKDTRLIFYIISKEKFHKQFSQEESAHSLCENLTPGLLAVMLTALPGRHLED